MSKELIIGSTAIKHHFPDFNRTPKDLDIAVSDVKGYVNKRGIEYLENPIIFKYSNDDEFISKDLLLSLKMSHLFFDINWNKHMYDVQFLLDKGCKYDEQAIFDLYDFWKQYHRSKRSDLNMTKEKFFTNKVNYDEHEHDDLHKIINSEPLYLSILKDGEEVLTCPDKFSQLSYEDKLELVREEVYVMAYERFRNDHFLIAHNRMLNKFIMQHVPLWMFTFTVENYKKLIRAKINFIELINNNKNGKFKSK